MLIILFLLLHMVRNFATIKEIIFSLISTKQGNGCKEMIYQGDEIKSTQTNYPAVTDAAEMNFPHDTESMPSLITKYQSGPIDEAVFLKAMMRMPSPAINSAIKKSA